jgi:hypothetical protein
VPLKVLEAELENLFEELGVSMTKFKEVVRWGRGCGGWVQGCKDPAVAPLPQPPCQQEMLCRPWHPRSWDARSQGICLRNAQAYGGPAALRAALRVKPMLIVSRKAAKEFKYVKKCLIEVFVS